MNAYLSSAVDMHACHLALRIVFDIQHVGICLRYSSNIKQKQKERYGVVSTLVIRFSEEGTGNTVPSIPRV